MLLNDFDQLHIRDPYDHDGLEGKVVVTSGNLLIHSQSGLLWDNDDLKTAGIIDSHRHYLGHYNADQVFTLEVSSEQLQGGLLATSDLRSHMGDLPEGLFRLLGRALQINDWYRAHAHCGYCGDVTAIVPGERAMGCSSCGKIFYPRLSPCIMGLVYRGEECLLARNSQWNTPRFSVIAGFIEPGESAEGAVHREVMEEVGVGVGALEYISSQPWPFPGQLMLGFFAEYHSGEIEVDGVEIAEAHWYRYDQLPTIPGPHSLSGQLIRTFIKRCGG